MKRIFLMVLMFSMFAGAVSFTFSQDQPAKVEDKNLDGVSTDESLKDKQPTAEELAYRADTATILKLLGNIRDFRYDSADTQVQAKAKEQKLQEALAQINVRFKGKSITLQRVTLEDVTPETVSVGLLNYKETGKYEAKYSIRYYEPLPFNYLTVEIIKIYPNESSVINLTKGSVAPLTGKIRKILYTDIINTLTLWID